MRLSVAQLQTVKGDVWVNTAKHELLIQQAVTAQADAIFFPELSITGYEPELAKELATTQADERFNRFEQLSKMHHITIGIGMPTVSDDGICISMLIFQPDGTRLTYSKQQLHVDELPYFIAGNEQLLIPVGNEFIAPAICYESLQPNHAATANGLGATVYMANVAKSQTGVDKAFVHYPAIARQYGMPVLMSNCTGYCDNFEAAGQSAVWNSEGVLLAQLDKTAEGILVFDTDTGTVEPILL
jgi:predicted amidohydrolase